MYTAVVTRITVRPHPNADKLALGTTMVGGFQVIVGKDTEDGTLGVFFPSDGQLSHDFCVANNLYKPAGMFEQNRRVKTIRLRGEQSEGFWCQLSYLEMYTKLPVDILPEGTELTEVYTFPLCNKYETPATVRARENREKQPRKSNRQRDLVARAMPQHFDTTQFRFVGEQMARMEGARYIVTEKLHGTSGRVGRVWVEQDRKWWQKWLQWLRVKTYPDYVLKTVHGTRRVILGSDQDQQAGFYGSHDFRARATEHLVAVLPHNTCVYFEIVGWVGPATSIMPPYGKPPQHFSYGTQPGECELYVYRITTNMPGMDPVEWTWEQVEEWCKLNTVKAVPVLYTGRVGPDFTQTVEAYTEGTSVLDERHIREGVVVRVEGEDRTLWAKNKSFVFREAEDKAKTDTEYVDMEEAT